MSARNPRLLSVPYTSEAKRLAVLWPEIQEARVRRNAERLLRQFVEVQYHVPPLRRLPGNGSKHRNLKNAVHLSRRMERRVEILDDKSGAQTRKN